MNARRMAQGREAQASLLDPTLAASAEIDAAFRDWRKIEETPETMKAWRAAETRWLNAWRTTLRSQPTTLAGVLELLRRVGEEVRDDTCNKDVVRAIKTVRAVLPRLCQGSGQ